MTASAEPRSGLRADLLRVLDMGEDKTDGHIVGRVAALMTPLLLFRSSTRPALMRVTVLPGKLGELGDDDLQLNIELPGMTEERAARMLREAAAALDGGPAE